MSIVDRLTDKVTPVVIQEGYFLWELKVTKAGKRSLVSIVLDKKGGASLDELAGMSREIAHILDDDPSLEEAYHLEVSSPGLERNLTTVEHYKWSVDLDVTVTYRVEGTIERSRGKLISVDDTNIVVQSEDIELGKISIPIETITKAHTLFDFEEAMKKRSDDSTDSDEDLIPQGETA